MSTVRKNISIHESQIKMLEKIRVATGATHSETIRHAVEEYHERLKRKGYKL